MIPQSWWDKKVCALSNLRSFSTSCQFVCSSASRRRSVRGFVQSISAAVCWLGKPFSKQGSRIWRRLPWKSVAGASHSVPGGDNGSSGGNMESLVQAITDQIVKQLAG